MRHERIIGVDPGSIFTGLAVMLDGEFVFWLESDDPCVVWQVIEEQRPDRVILENMLGSGRRDEHIQKTTKVLGYLEYQCRGHGIACELVPQQARLANVQNVPAYIRGKDERAAAAHCLSDRERKRLESTRSQHNRGTQRRGRTSPLSDAG